MDRVLMLSCAIALLAVYHGQSQLRLRIARRDFANRHGCQLPPRNQHKNLLGRLFGLDIIQDMKKGLAESTLLEQAAAKFDEYGATYESAFMGYTVINSIDPRNIQAWSTSSFTKFGREPLRRAMKKEIWGRGIMSTDGAYWEHSRNLIRPTFKKTEVGNLALFKKHADRLFKLLPRDGSTVDLSTYFKNYIFDSSTDFLLGQCANCQYPEDASEDAKKFIASFEEISGSTGKSRFLGKLAWKADADFKRSVKILHDYLDKCVARALDLRKREKKQNNDRFILLNEMAELDEDPIDLRFQILHVFVPDHDSTGTLLGAAMYALANNPGTWQTLRTEIIK
ncbi:hypothetical protein MMC25_007230 [Agyrium rufum]|nr:hypothetical protein [Agyrium rufum]